jgi:hypothetical protein
MTWAEEMKTMKLIEKRPLSGSASYQAVTQVNAQVASKVMKPKGSS